MKKVEYLGGYFGFESDKFEFEDVDKIMRDLGRSNEWEGAILKDLKGKLDSKADLSKLALSKKGHLDSKKHLKGLFPSPKAQNRQK